MENQGHTDAGIRSTEIGCGFTMIVMLIVGVALVLIGLFVPK
jgi:hypothetical protein